MTGQAHGLVDMRAHAGNNTSVIWQECYIGVLRFLTSSQAASLGITRIAYSSGSFAGGVINASGLANDYWDTPNTTGDNAWAVFQFASASCPWYMLVQWGNLIGSVPGNPGKINQSNLSGLGFQFAIRTDGGNPWGGTTRNDGTDTKGSTVWISGSTSAYVHVFPRENASSGSFSSQRQNLTGFWSSGGTGTGPGVGTRFHVIADKDQFIYLHDSAGNTTYTACYFGVYTPRSGSNPPIPCVCWCNTNTETYDPFIQIGSTYGYDNASSILKGGGVSSPFPWGEVRLVQFSGINEFWTTNFQPNNNFSTPTYDEFPVHLGCVEWPSVGYLGTLDYNFVRYIYNCGTHDTDAAFSRAIFGNASTASCKISVPWSGIAAPGTFTTRSGSYF